MPGVNDGHDEYDHVFYTFGDAILVFNLLGSSLILTATFCSISKAYMHCKEAFPAG